MMKKMHEVRDILDEMLAELRWRYREDCVGRLTLSSNAMRGHEHMRHGDARREGWWNSDCTFLYQALCDDHSIRGATLADLKWDRLDDVVSRMAARETDEALANFRAKQERKYGDVIGRKGISGYRVHGDRLDHVSIDVECPDGSRFMATNKVVIGRSPKGY